MEPGSDTQVALVKRLRRMLYTKAEYFKTKDQPQFFKYLLDIDKAFNVKRCENTGGVALNRDATAPYRT